MDKKLKPSLDPNSPKYKNDPSRVWYGGRWMTLESQARLAERSRQRWANDHEFRQRRRTMMKAYYDSGYRDVMKDRIRNDPELRERNRQRKLTANMTDEQIERQRARMRERYANDPEFRERVLQRARAGRESQLARRRERMQDPEYRERINNRRRERYANDPEHRERTKTRAKEHYARFPEWRARARERMGIDRDAPILSKQEQGRLAARIKGIREAVADKHAMNVIESCDPRRAQLMRLSVNEGASPFERKKALAELDKHNVKQATKEPTCQHSQITSAGTPTPRLLPRSTSC